ncbi:hypothetical protein [Ulvibacter sp. MAR_2010_11]|uniref:hypothetical protein n=1 Tax=Ulvibacter sp. MAR_2010_11 TaxID=1250229 RepID=UPI000C2CE036|nr:hypothetical protein [Ulvibacter sp. MAR_2010_11]
MKNIFVLFFIIPLIAGCQNFGALTIVSSLPNNLKEASGMEFLEGSDLMWIVLDAGNDATLYGVNAASEKVEKAITISNAQNHDWEDLATDGKGNLYIGDFGNNNNKRENLAIYTVSNVLQIAGSTTEAIKTTFHYEDQQEFPPKRNERNFDAEAFIYINNYFYVFTRNRSSNFDGVTKLYKIPAQEGDFEAKLIGEYTVCKDSKDCQVTSATIDYKTGTIALLTYNKVFLMSNYSEDYFFKGDIEEIRLGYRSQLESLCFQDSETLFMADERHGVEGGNIYSITITSQ